MPQNRAFLVEDNPVIRDSLIPAMQELADVEVVDWAKSESEALDWLADHADEVELVVLDMFLSQGTGLGVLKGLRERGIRAVVIVLTNHATRDMRERCQQSGAQAFFDKARENEEFFDYLRSTLG